MDTISHQTRLTSAEIANLWSQYMNDSLGLCVLSYFSNKCHDKDIRSVLEMAIGLSKSHLEKIKGFLTEENYPIPQGFTDEDVDLSAPALFSDSFSLFYLYTMTLHGMNGYSLAVGTSVREDQRIYFIQVAQETTELYDKIVSVMLEKGLFSRPPYINPPHDLDFVTKQSYLTSWFGKRRPLNAIEISNIYYNVKKTTAKVVLEIGFSQVTQSKPLRQYFQRGAEICNKHIEVFGSILTEDHLSIPTRWDSEVTNSTKSPFSDKLMLFHIVSLLSVAVGYYGVSLSVCQRRDLMVQYTRLMGEMGQYAEDGMNLLIKNGWMEQPPIAENREALAAKK